MSLLYPLPIQGQGTARIEALSSFLMRLAHLHGVSTALLIQHVCQADGGNLSPSAVLASPISAVIRPNGTTDGLVRALAKAGRDLAQDLECLTMLALADALDRGMKTYSPHLRWCPGCLGEQIRGGLPGYFHLAWQISLLTTCADHGIRLRDRCPHCNGRQDGYRHREDLSRCVKCNGRLDVIFTSDLSTVTPIKEITDLVEHTSQNPGLRFPAGGISLAVRTLLDEAWSRNGEEELYRILRRDDCIRFADRDEPVTLLSALRLSHRLQVSLVALLRGDLSGSSLSVFRSRDDGFPGSLTPRPRQRIDVARVEQAAAIHANESAVEAPVSLKALGRMLSVSTGAIRYRCPSACDLIVARHRRKEVDRMRALRRAARRAVTHTIRKWASTGVAPLSRKSLLKALRKATNLPKRVLVAEIARHFITFSIRPHEAST